MVMTQEQKDVLLRNQEADRGRYPDDNALYDIVQEEDL